MHVNIYICMCVCVGRGGGGGGSWRVIVCGGEYLRIKKKKQRIRTRDDGAEDKVTQSRKGRVNMPKGGIKDFSEDHKRRHQEDGTAQTRRRTYWVVGQEAPSMPILVGPKRGPAGPSTKERKARHHFPTRVVVQTHRLHLVR